MKQPEIPLDFIPTRIIIHPPRSPRASSRGAWTMERGAAPAGGTDASLAPGRLWGSARRVLRPGCQELADGGAGRFSRGFGARQGEEPNWREETDGGTEQPREARPGAGVKTPHGAPSGAAPDQSGRPRRQAWILSGAARRSIPRTCVRGRKNETATGRRIKPRGDDAWLFECLAV